MSSTTSNGTEPRCFTDLLDRQIQALGFSVRRSKKIRKAIFSIWAAALARGEEVETPLGSLKAVPAARRRLRWNKMRRRWEKVNTRPLRIEFTPRPELVNVIPTHFFQGEDEALLKKMGRKPWATTMDELSENEEALKQAKMPPPPKTREQMSYSEKMTAAKPPLPAHLVPALPQGTTRWQVPSRAITSDRNPFRKRW